MKNTVMMAILVLAAMCCPAMGRAQDRLQDRLQSAEARARITAAKKLPEVTLKQCTSTLTEWGERDNIDDKREKHKLSDWVYWYELISTEELLRLRGTALMCGAAFKKAHLHSSFAMMVSYQNQFNLELLDRAEQVIFDHDLMLEYLNQRSSSTGLNE